MTRELMIGPTGERAIRIERGFDASPARVFKAHTEPDLVKQWLTGPKGWVMTHCTIDLRVGGRQRFLLRHEDGREMGWGGEYRDIIPARLLLHTEVFDEDWTGGETLNRLDFISEGNGTRLVHTMELTSEKARDETLRSGMERGIVRSYELLDALVGRSSSSRDQPQ